MYHYNHQSVQLNLQHTILTKYLHKIIFPIILTPTSLVENSQYFMKILK